MSQACSEIAGNVIFLSTISLLPVWVTENEADWTSEIQASERKLENSLPNANPCPEKTGIRVSFFPGREGFKILALRSHQDYSRKGSINCGHIRVNCSLNIPHLELSFVAFPSHMLWRSWRCEGSFFSRLSIVTFGFQSNMPKVEVTTPS